ncbi:MAG: nucleoside hydrolase [Proteobacteria bacterium]|nr:nucleoside hydrolase [Pseudomonadota bacterium]
MPARPIIIDTDPGQDDAVAILVALASPAELEVLAVTTVAGNVPLALTSENARKIRDLAGRPEVPVYAGCPRPILRPLRTAEKVHGPTGLDGADLPPPRAPLAEGHAVDFIVEALRAHPEPVTLATMGPLTNVALALIKAPDIAGRVREIVMMGGAVRGGNVTPVAEFNVYVDPHAARVVFESGVPIVMHGLDVTHKVITTPERLAAIRAIGTPVAEAAAGLLAFYDRRDLERYGAPGGPLHDPCVIAYLLAPGLFAGRRVHVAVVTDEGPALGQTVADWWGTTGRAPNALVVDRVDADGFYALLTERLARL